MAVATYDAETVARLRVAIGRLHRRFVQNATEPLPFSQISALASVEAAGPIRLGELAARERVAPPSLTRTLKALFDSGYVTKEPDPEDGRSMYVSITDSGRGAMERMRRDRMEMLTRRTALITDEQYAALRAAVPVLEFLAAEDDDEGPLEPAEPSVGQ